MTLYTGCDNSIPQIPHHFLNSSVKKKSQKRLAERIIYTSAREIFHFMQAKRLILGEIPFLEHTALKFSSGRESWKVSLNFHQKASLKFQL